MSETEFDAFYQKISGYITTLDTRELLRRAFEAGRDAHIEEMFGCMSLGNEEGRTSELL